VLTVRGATVDRVDTKYVTGAQLFWRPPVEGLRVGGTWLRTSIDFELTLSQQYIDLFVMMGVVPPDFDGRILIAQRPDTWVIGSVEYTRGDWLFAGEYSRAYKRQITVPKLIPELNEDAERLYAMATNRLSSSFELGGYYSASHVDAHDRDGRDLNADGTKKYPIRSFAWQRDLAVTLRYDVNDHWLWKLEGHFIDGTAALSRDDNPDPERYWALFLLRTTVTF
jgi:hypothetical protein